MTAPALRPRHLGQLAALWAALALAGPAQAMEALDEGRLAQVSGRDGLNFNLKGFALSGHTTLTYTAPDGSSLAIADFALSRSDDADHLFDDPYSLSVRRRSGGADVVELAFPANAAGLARWQFAADLAVATASGTVQAGALLLQDLALYGGGLQISTPSETGVEGVAFGLGLRAELGALVLRPRGRDNATEELRISGLRLGGVNADGSWTGQPWQLAEVSSQPGLFRAMTDEKGPALQLQIGWSSAAGGAPLGGLQIDNLRFNSDVSGALDLGSSRIGSMQIQFLDVRLRGN